MKKPVFLGFVVIATMLIAGTALSAGRNDFGGNGQAWVELMMGDGTYWDHTRNDDLSKDWQTPNNGVRFTQPGKAEGRANGNSVIEPYPCPGTQVYPGSNSPNK